MKMRRVEKIPAPLQPLGHDFRPDRLVGMQRGLGQIQKPQARPEKKNGNPNEADSRERHVDSLWLLAEMVKVFKRFLGLRPIGDIQNHKGDLRAVAGLFAPKLQAYAFGEDDRPLDLDGEIKSISAEETFERDTQERRILVAALIEQARDIAAKLTKERHAARTVQVKVATAISRR